jgi:hypothetical protein
MGNILGGARCALVSAVLLAAVVLSGCAADDDDLAETISDIAAQPIVGGVSASAFPEAVLVNMPGSICSGALIAPRVVLTAGHCVDGVSSWSIVAPFAGNQRARGSSVWTEYTNTGSFVNPNLNDVAVIGLDRAISLSAYPTLATAPVPTGTKAINVGRKKDGVASSSSLFFGKEVTLRPARPWGFPFSYISEEVIEAGDSGGPVYAGTGSARTIVAVNSGGGGGTQVLARVDLAHAKIQDVIAQTGGTAVPAAPAACTGTAEVEPNDTSTAANALSGARCGALATGSDLDWYTFSRSAGAAYDVTLAAEDDAEILAWRWTGTAWTALVNATPTRVSGTSPGTGPFMVVVRSKTGAAQSYRIALAP